MKAGLTKVIDEIETCLGDLRELHKDWNTLANEGATSLHWAQEIEYMLNDAVEAASLDELVRELDGIESRLAELETLFRRLHVVDEAECLELLSSITLELEEFDDPEQAAIKYTRRFKKSFDEYHAKAKQVHQWRIDNLEKVNTELVSFVHQLSMPHAQIDWVVKFNNMNEHTIDLEFARSMPSHWNEMGMDLIDLEFSPNPGEGRGRLDDWASGGERARVLLVLLGMTGDQEDETVLVFDEVDTGLSGQAGFSVGEHMAQLALNHQVLAVTHVQSVACHATQAVVVSKKLTEIGRTVSCLKTVSGKELDEVRDTLFGTRSAR